MNIERVDVVVVGAGPAGSTAARYVAQSGVEVLLIEKREKIGVPVKCGEFLPTTEEVRTILPATEDLEELFGIPEDLVSLRTHSMRIYSPRMREYEFDFEGYTTDRDRFDQYLADRAEEAGAELVTGLRCNDVEGNEVVTDEGRIRAEVIIGADGPTSTVASSIGLPRPSELYIAVTSFVEGGYDPVAEMYFGMGTPGGYAWVLPKKKGANIGVGVSPRYATKSINEYMRDFAQWKGLEIGEISGKPVPVSGPVSNTVTGVGMTVGDAAGHVMAVNGGGIPIAMICGRIAGRIAADSVLRGISLQRYDTLWRSKVEKPLRTAVRTKRLASPFWGGPRRLELAMMILGTRRMSNIIRCKPAFP